MIPTPIPLRDEATFRLAMRHRSAASNPVADSYERLEYFGDSVLGLIVAEYLFEHHPDQLAVDAGLHDYGVVRSD